MKRRHALILLAGAPVLAATAAPTLPPVTVYKSPTCGCCGAWVDHLKAAGFTVTVVEVDDTAPTRAQLGMPQSVASCHSASVGGYVVEGHVPAPEIKRLLVAKPAAVGLAVPGMPLGSPGMEVDDERQPYSVLLVQRNGRHSVFASYPKSRRS